MTKIRLEAEALTLQNYVRESLDFASSGVAAKLPKGSGTITTTLGPDFSAGLYNIVVTYFDENDGRSQMEMRVGGQLVDSWVLDKDPNVAAGYVTVQRTVATGQRLAAGTTIELKGTQNKGEFARVDYIELERVGDALTPSNTAPSAVNDSATTTAQQPVTINVLSNDGDVDGDALTVTNFTNLTAAGGSVSLNTDKTLTYTPSASYSGSDSFSYSISDGRGGTDTATVAVQVNATTPPSPPPSSGGAKIRLEAESLTLQNYVRENLDFASAGTSVKLPGGSGTITTTLGQNFSAGLYNIAVTYFDENDGRSQMEMRIGGRLVDSWVLDKDPNVAAGHVTVQRTVALDQTLAPGTTIELKGTKNKGEFARVDYIELERVGDAPVAPGPSPDPNDGGVILNLQKNVALSPLFGALGTPRIMPLGDSITVGQHSQSPVPGAYRIQFWNRSVANGLTIDFVGSQNNGTGSLPDGDHSGFGGRKINDITSIVNKGEISQYPSDAILLMIGTNDANSGSTGTEMRDRLSTLIDTITNVAPDTYLFVSSIPPVDDPKGAASAVKNIPIYNALIPNLVEQKSNQGKRVFYVNAGGSLELEDLNGTNSLTAGLVDGVHPTAAGYSNLGDAWYNQIFNPRLLTSSNLEGTQFADRLIGNSSSNVLRGNGGRDQLTGGGGADIFDYKDPTHGIDTVTDFGSDDVFRISAAGFGGGLMSNMTLDNLSFITGSNPNALASSATFLYDTVSNLLSFDRDGTGSSAAFGIATLTNGYSLQASQIDIVA